MNCPQQIEFLARLIYNWIENTILVYFMLAILAALNNFHKADIQLSKL